MGRMEPRKKILSFSLSLTPSYILAAAHTSSSLVRYRSFEFSFFFGRENIYYLYSSRSLAGARWRRGPLSHRHERRARARALRSSAVLLPLSLSLSSAPGGCCLLPHTQTHTRCVSISSGGGNSRAYYSSPRKKKKKK